jgi:flavin-dependent trigonelline monooxygenase, oxygenase component
VPNPIQQPTPPMWIAARDPDSHDFAVRSGCNVMVTPLMKGDEEVVHLKRKFDDRGVTHRPLGGGQP